MRFLVTAMIIAIILTGCGNGDSENSEPTEQKQEQTTETNIAVSFRNIDLTVEDYKYQLTGQAQITDNVFYYTVEQGKNLLKEETEIKLDEAVHGWSDFEIIGELPETVDGHSEPPIISLYGKDENGGKVNPNYIPIDISMN